MDLNFKEALAALYPGLAIVLIRAGIFAAGGCAVIIVFGMVLFAFPVAGSVVGGVVSVSALLGLAAGGLVAQRFFLFRYRAAMLLLFSGRALRAPGPAAAIHESRNLFSNYSRWRASNIMLRRALPISSRWNGQSIGEPRSGRTRRFFDRLAGGIVSQAVLALAFSRGGPDIAFSVREGLALFSFYGAETRRQAQRWMWFSVAGLLILFLCLALPNWFIFSAAGAPVVIGIALAAIISGLLHQAFIVPFVLAGVCGPLLVQARGKTPDPAFCEQLAPLFTP